ncbi:hypothetical protein DB30_05042 [Enhygromyxa salina]|uniref:Uncharacterized protein n=1 Tax=Enhygromyxa salina TaxID=215803 RepID=A0A0C1ZXQ4_9BACT|nr:hypothetical protein [Enhygromyxa salina]KIG15988.1 hypothetical protein DB30_05042 [Enhygromyxa salina]
MPGTRVMIAALLGCVLGSIGTLGCANNDAWSVSEARTCAPKAAPRVCVSAEPDHGHVVEFGGVQLLPGECAVAASEGRGGWVRLETRSPRRERQTSRLRVPRGRATIVQIGADGQAKRIGRLACDGTPITVEARTGDRLSAGATERPE